MLLVLSALRLSKTVAAVSTMPSLRSILDPLKG
jgi:hypothetical protein